MFCPRAKIILRTRYGSLALLKAAEAGLTDQSMVIDRISSSLYGRAATVLKRTAVQQIAQRIDASIHCAVGLPIELVTPEIELEAEYIFSENPILFSVSERETPSENIEDFFRRLSESDNEFRDRQKHNKDSFVAFREELTAAKAHIILDHLTHEDFAALAVIDPEIINKWGDHFMEINDTRLPVVHNLILLVASAIADTNPEKSVLLFERTAHSRPLVRFTLVRAALILDQLAYGREANLHHLMRCVESDWTARQLTKRLQSKYYPHCNAIKGLFLIPISMKRLRSSNQPKLLAGLWLPAFAIKAHTVKGY